METCEICKETFNNLKGLTTHVNAKHHLNGKEYYDNYLKKEGEGQCIVCSGETTYRNVGVGYLENCSMECRNKNKAIKHDYWKGKHQTKEHIDKRIENTSQKDKENNRKKTMLLRYGVDNPTKLDKIKSILSKKSTGRKFIRTHQWQRNIIDAKRKNGTLKHTEETKKKISVILNNYYAQNLDRERNVKNNINVNHICGWYKNLYFRSSLELSFLINNNNQKFLTCENNEYKVVYLVDGKQKVYFPDFTDGKYIYEIKPSKMISLFNNEIKISEAKKVYGEKYKLITEIESPYVKKQIIIDLINIGEVILSENSKNKLKKYKH